jgi:hypothetical protein
VTGSVPTILAGFCLKTTRAPTFLAGLLEDNPRNIDLVRRAL